MAVVTVTERWYDRNGLATIEGEKGAVRTFQVVTDSRDDDHSVVLASAQLPAPGAAHPNDLLLYCDSVEVAVDSRNGKVWDVVATYTNRNSGGKDPGDPTNDAAVLTWGTDSYQEVVEKATFVDHNDNDTLVPNRAVANSAGDRFDPPLTINAPRPTLSAVKNVTSVASLSAWLLTYRGSVNNSSFVVDGITIGPHVALLASVEISGHASRNSVSYRTVSLKLQFNPDTWDEEIADRGFRKLDANDKPVKITSDGDKEPISTPAFLDGEGGVLAHPEWAATQHVFLKYRAREEKNFNVLLPLFQ